MSRSEAEECLLEDATPSAAGEDGYSSDFRYIRRMAREEARQVRRRVKRIMLGDRLHQFILSSQAVPVAVGVVFGSCLKNNVDAFVTAFIAPSIAAMHSPPRHALHRQPQHLSLRGIPRVYDRDCVHGPRLVLPHRRAHEHVHVAEVRPASNLRGVRELGEGDREAVPVLRAADPLPTRDDMNSESKELTT